MQFQKEGTLLGFIIGVVVGLMVAMAVAVYVTKVPVPFLNKSQSRTIEQDAAEAKKNKDWDPNAPLYGKSANKPQAAASVVPAPEAAVTPDKSSAAPASNSKPENKPAVADPLGDLAKAKLAGGDPFTYLIQVGAFRSADDAESQRAKLSLAGVDAKVTEREQSGRQIFRVRVGPYEKKEDADTAKGKLEAAGYETALVRVQR